jgi:hypothetical protein
MTATAAPDDAHPIQVKPRNVDNVAGNWVTNAMLLQWAIAYATHGTPVFPCCPWDGAYNDYKGNPIKAKAPLVAHGFKDATTDINQIRRWWETLFPFAMIGRMVPADQVCIDIDPWKGGKLSDLQAIVGFPLGREPATQSTWSGRNDGGTHLFFQRPFGPLVSTKLPKGIDLRVGGNHYTIIAPSIHPETGGAYAWMWDNETAPCPRATQIPVRQPVPSEDVRTRRVAAALPAAHRRVRQGDIGERPDWQGPCLLVSAGSAMPCGCAAGASQPMTTASQRTEHADQDDRRSTHVRLAGPHRRCPRRTRS